MDTQLIEDFNRLYFSKSQISRRVLDKDEFEEVWLKIQTLRLEKSNAENLGFNLSVKYWYNDVQDILSNLRFIDDSSNTDLFNYLPKKNIKKVNSFLKDNEWISLIREFNDIDTKDANKIIEFINKSNNVDEKFLFNLYILISKNKLENDESFKDIFKILNDREDNKVIKAITLSFLILSSNAFNNYSKALSNIIAIKYLIENGYDILNYCKVSKLLKEKKKKYIASIENSIECNLDITYFIKFYTEILKESIQSFNTDLNQRFGKKIIKELIEKNNLKLEDRQVKFIDEILNSKENIVTIDDYKVKTKVAYETARGDLNNLVVLGFFKIAKVSKRYEYHLNDIAIIVKNLEEQ